MNHKKLSAILFSILLILVGGLLVLDTVLLVVLRIGNFSLGLIMPFIIGTPLLLIGIFFGTVKKFFNRHIFGKILVYIAVLAYISFAVLLSITTALTFSAAKNTPPQNADVIIVLGCGVKGERVTLTLANRLNSAIDYVNANPNTVNIVSGGLGEGEHISEALAMKRYLVAHNIDEKKIYMEDKSTSTIENFKFSNEIINDLFPNGAKIVFVTTNFHVYRAELVAKKVGIDAAGIGSESLWYITINNYLRECAAITQYWITGKI
ncbi:MAG: YdcF family protein [Clostridiales bacterium]|nr:YdcF family protein [Clostridiales bacterium]